jgi:hypothetical protein
MGSRTDRKTKLTESDRELIHAKITIAKLEDLIAGQSDLEENTIGEMSLICERHAGYWRLGRTSAGMFWVRWKWTSGVWTGQYVIGGHNSLWDALVACLAEIEAVESGSRKPLFDGPMRR